jgi:hypothetical protein
MRVIAGTVCILVTAALVPAQDKTEVKEAAVAAQLAVCRGALTTKPPSNVSTAADDVEAHLLGGLVTEITCAQMR